MATTKKTEPQAFHTGIDLWKQITEVYTDFTLQAVQTSFDQGMAVWEQLDRLMVDAYEKAGELTRRQQEMFLEAAEQFASQARSTAEKMGKLYEEQS